MLSHTPFAASCLNFKRINNQIIKNIIQFHIVGRNNLQRTEVKARKSILLFGGFCSDLKINFKNIEV